MKGARKNDRLREEFRGEVRKEGEVERR